MTERISPFVQSLADMVGQKLSSVDLPCRVETRSDAHQELRDDAARQRYIAEYGDVIVKRDVEFDVYRVPAFAKQIAEYVAAKRLDCDRWGCE